MPIGTVGCIRDTTRDSTNTRQRNGRWQTAVFAGAFWSHLSFEDGEEPTLYQYAAIGEIAYHFPNRTSLALNAGSVLGGRFTFEDKSEIYLTKGVVVSVKGTWNFLLEKKAIPFMVASLSLSFSKVFAEPYQGLKTSFTGSDVRFGLTAGYTIGKAWQVYLSPKVFGGPIFRHYGSDRVQGRDRYFIQAGLGSSLILPKGFVLFVNGSVAGEQAVGGGVVKSF